MAEDLLGAHRIVVAGTSGSGKSTLAAAIGTHLGIPYMEIDSLFHGSDWEPRPTFLQDVADVAAGDSWVSEWQYEGAREILARRAEVMVWLDYSSAVQMSRVIRRTIRRRVTRAELWNGNSEGPFRNIFTNSDHIVRWAWNTRNKHRNLDQRIATEFPQLGVIRLATPHRAKQWVSRLNA